MRYVEFTSGVQTYVNKEEQELIETVSENPVKKRDLKEREQEVARHLTQKSILIRQKINDHIIYRINNNANFTSSY